MDPSRREYNVGLPGRGSTVESATATKGLLTCDGERNSIYLRCEETARPIVVPTNSQPFTIDSANHDSLKTVTGAVERGIAVDDTSVEDAHSRSSLVRTPSVRRRPEKVRSINVRKRPQT